ncbi:unnamed protein product [Calypogeia fissa]
MMGMLMDECGGMDYLMPSVGSVTGSSVLLAFYEHVPDLKSLMSGTGTSSVVSNAIFAATHTTCECEGEPLASSEQSGTSSQGSTHQERAWRDLERTGIGNEVKWTCTMAPTTPKGLEMPLYCLSDDSVEPSCAGGAVEHMTDSPTSTLTADSERDNFGDRAISNYDLDTLQYARLQCQEVDKNHLDIAGRLLSDGYSLFDLEPSSPFPMISADFEAAEDCNSPGSCASDLRWSASREQLPALDGIVFQDPCDILGPVPMLHVGQTPGYLPGGVQDSLEIVAHQISDSVFVRGTVEENLSSDVTVEDKEERGVELVQKLVACAQAISGGELGAAQDHVKRLRHLMSPTGSSMERVATYFTKALSARLDGELLGYQGCNVDSYMESSTVEQKLIAYQNFYSSCPYLIVTHFTANQAIVEAFEGEERVHIVDLDIKQGLQWPSLIQALSERPVGPPQLRITGVAGDSLDMKSLIATKKRLLDFADIFNVPLEFTVIKQNIESLQPWMLGIRDDEALAVNCVSSLHKLVGHPRVSIDSFLLMIHRLEPSIFTIVEEDADHDQEFLPRFMNALHYYSSMFDSLAASCRALEERERVERLLLGMDMMDIVGREGQERLARHQTADIWIQRMTRLGFRLRPLSSRSIIQANCLLSMYPDSKYCLTSQESILSIGWQGEPLYYVSSWCLNNNF